MTPPGAIGVANFTSAFGAYGIMANEAGGNGINYVTARDPRIPVNDTSATFQNWPRADVILPRTVLMLAAAITTIGCAAGDNPQMWPRGNDPSRLFWATTLNHRGATMAVSQTLQLHAETNFQTFRRDTGIRYAVPCVEAGRQIYLPVSMQVHSRRTPRNI